MTDFFSDISGIFSTVEDFFEGSVDFLSDDSGSILGEDGSAWNSILRTGADFFGTSEEEEALQEGASSKLTSGLLSAAAVKEISPSRKRTQAKSGEIFKESVSPQNLDAFWLQRMANITK